MPIYTIAGEEFELQRNFAILDTNVLVHRFVNSEDHHGDMVDMFSASRYQWLVSYAVVQESWNMILKKSKNPHKEVMDFYRWLYTPGSNVLLIPLNNRLLGDLDVYRKYEVDCVDGALLKLAESIGEQCKVDSIIATYDSRDFYKLWNFSRSFQLYNMKEDYIKLV